MFQDACCCSFGVFGAELSYSSFWFWVGANCPLTSYETTVLVQYDLWRYLIFADAAPDHPKFHKKVSARFVRIAICEYVYFGQSTLNQLSRIEVLVCVGTAGERINKSE